MLLGGSKAMKSLIRMLREFKMTPVKWLIANTIAWLIGFVWILPFIGIFMASIRPFEELVEGWWNFASFHPTLEKYYEALFHPYYPLWRGLINSLIITVPSTIIPVLLAAMASYAFARFSFPIKNYLFLTMLFIMAVPQQMMVIPLFFMMNSIGLLDTYLGLILIHSSWGIPWITFFLRNYFSMIPKEYEEAALVDGATYWQIFTRIVFPVSLPGIISAAVLQFAWVLNDFFFALVFLLSPEKYVATRILPSLKGEYHVDWGLLSAGSILVMLIPVLLYFALNKYYIRGFTGWALKG